MYWREQVLSVITFLDLDVMQKLSDIIFCNLNPTWPAEQLWNFSDD